MRAALINLIRLGFQSPLSKCGRQRLGFTRLGFYTQVLFAAIIPFTILFRIIFHCLIGFRVTAADFVIRFSLNLIGLHQIRVHKVGAKVRVRLFTAARVFSCRAL